MRSGIQYGGAALRCATGAPRLRELTWIREDGIEWTSSFGTYNSNLPEEMVMKTWTRPVIVEIQVGMEINCYVCAEL